jgi:hypothetical protein
MALALALFVLDFVMARLDCVCSARGGCCSNFTLLLRGVGSSVKPIKNKKIQLGGRREPIHGEIQFSWISLIGSEFTLVS